MNHSTTRIVGGKSKSSKKEDPPIPEHHNRQFRGTFAAAPLHDFVEKGIIKPAHGWLVMVIDSLCQNGKGCYASNEYLGKKMHLSAPQIKKMLAKLEKVGLLWSEFEGKIRWLKIDSLCECKRRRKTTYSADSRSSTRRLKNEPLEGSKMSPLNNNNSISEITPARSSASGRGERVNAVEKVVSTTPKKIAVSQNGKTHSSEMELALYLKEAFLRVGKFSKMSRMDKWERAIRQTTEEVSRRDNISYDKAQRYLDKIYRDHADNIKHKWQPKLYTPWRMRDDFVRLEDAYKRRREQPRQNKDYRFTGGERLRDDEIL